jgi:hypothetical protein
MKNNQKIILAFIILILFGLSLSTGLSFYVFIGSWEFVFYTIVAGIIFGCFQSYTGLFKYLTTNFVNSIIFSSFCVFGERFFLILTKMFPANQYYQVFKTDLKLAIFLALFFFVSTIIGVLVKKSLINCKEWLLTYKK